MNQSKNGHFPKTIPKGWQVKEFRKVFEFIKTTSFSRNKLTSAVTKNKVKYIHYGDIHKKFKLRVLDVSNERIPYLKDEFVNKEKFRFLKDGDLVIADASEDYEGVAECVELRNIAETPIIGGLHTIVARDKEGLTYNGFRVYIFKNKDVSNELKMIASGLSVFGISKGNLSKIPLLIPPPPEQKKIAAVLTTIQEAWEKTEAVIEAARQLKKSMMKHLLTYGPVAVKGAEKVKLKETEISMVPEEWKTTTLDQIAYKSKDTVKPTEIEKCRYVGLEHIIPGELTLRISGFSDEVKSSKHIFKTGDLLFGKLRPYLDKVALAEFEGICSTDILVFRNKNNCTNIFLGYLMHTQGFLNRAIATMTGVNHPRTSWMKLKKLSIGLPSIKIQQEITDKMQTIDQKIATETAKKEALDKLFKSLLDQLMTGQLRVVDLDI